MTDRGEIFVLPEPVPRTMGELAQRSVDRARLKMECAEVELRGALERQRLIVEYGKADEPLQAELRGPGVDAWNNQKDTD